MEHERTALEETGAATGSEHDGSRAPHSLSYSQLRSLSEKSSEVLRAPRPVHRFEKGNRFGGRRHAANPVEEMDRIARETVNRLRRPQFDCEIDADGKRTRVERPLDASRGNAIANLLRLRADLYSQYRVGETVAKLTAELEELHAGVRRIKQSLAG